MKKNNLFLVLLTALLVMSCSKDETTMSIPQESNAITFGTYVGRDAKTRATALDLDGLKADEIGFGVFAFYSNETTNEYNNTTPLSNFTPNFMYNQQVTWNTSKWEYAPVKYWPNEASDKLTFFAYAPYSTGSTNNISDFTGKTATGDPTLLFTVAPAATAQTDLLYADSTSLKNLGKQTIGGKVTFPFKHALSRIGFNVEVMADVVTGASGTLDTNTVVSVEKVELIGNFVSSDTFNFATGAWTGTATTVSPVDPAYSLGVANFETFATTAGTGVTTAKAKLNLDDSYLMVIPKTFTSDANKGLKIRVTYKVKTSDTSLSPQYSEVENVITSDEFAFTFETGKAYSFNLHLGLTSVKFRAEVAGWGTEKETVVNVPINTTTP